MFKFFVDPGAVLEDEILITGDDVNHIKNVLRMKPGETVLASVGDEREYQCEISHIEDTQVHLCIVDVYGSNRELPAKITLFQALPKSDKMELIIQKAVELGVNRIVPMTTKRVVVKLDEKKEAKKVTRWNAIAEAAAKQSKRNVIPEVTAPISFSGALKEMAQMECKLIPYENAEGMDGARELVAKAVGAKSIGIMIGSEGGFTPEEVEQAKERGVHVISLGHRILRTETAGMAMLAILMFAMEQDE